MMHSGHMNAVRQAKLLADEVGGILIVGVHTDAEIEANKGPPVMHDQERLALVAAVKWVDELVFDTPYAVSIPFLDSIDCDFCVHGDDISLNSEGKDAYADAKKNGRMKVVKRTEGVSTTDLVGRLLLLTRQHHDPSTADPIRASDSGSPAAAEGAISTAESGEKIAEGGGDGCQVGEGYQMSNISSSGVSQFLPTTWRLRQFSNGTVPDAGQRIIYVDGAFDMLHAGHVHALYAARRMGDFLLLGLHDDNAVNCRMGQNHPIMSLHERALCVLALNCVDEVILGAPLTISRDLVRSMNIHLVVESPDEPQPHATSPPTSPSRASTRDRWATARELGIFRAAPSAHPLSTEDIVQRIFTNRVRYEKRNAGREKKELDYVTKQKTYVREL